MQSKYFIAGLFLTAITLANTFAADSIQDENTMFLKTRDGFDIGLQNY